MNKLSQFSSYQRQLLGRLISSFNFNHVFLSTIMSTIKDNIKDIWEDIKKYPISWAALLIMAGLFFSFHRSSSTAQHKSGSGDWQIKTYYSYVNPSEVEVVKVVGFNDPTVDTIKDALSKAKIVVVEEPPGTWLVFPPKFGNSRLTSVKVIQTNEGDCYLILIPPTTIHSSPGEDPVAFIPGKMALKTPKS